MNADPPRQPDDQPADPQPVSPLRGESREAALRRIYGNASRYATGSHAANTANAASPAGKHVGRPWIAVEWECCSTYSRVYRNDAGTAYAGRCPKCGRQASVRVGPGGTDARFFKAG